MIEYTEGKSELPEKPILLTFDDGCYNNYIDAFPLSKKDNAKFVFSDVINYSECVNEHEILKKVGKQDLDLGKTAMCRTNKNTE